MKGDLSRAALTRPEDLTPEQVEEAAVDLVIRALKGRIGEPVNPDGLRISYGPPPVRVAETELETAVGREAAMLSARLADFDTARSCIMAAWLFPNLRAIFAEGAIDEGVAKVFLDVEVLRPVALAALNEHCCQEALDALKSRSTSGAQALGSSRLAGVVMRPPPARCSRQTANRSIQART